MQRKPLKLETQRKILGYFFLLPIVVMLTVFMFYPIVKSVVMSFTNYNLFQPPEFVGFYNYYKLFFMDDIFIQSFQNTLKFALITGPVG